MVAKTLRSPEAVAELDALKVSEGKYLGSVLVVSEREGKIQEFIKTVDEPADSPDEAICRAEDLAWQMFARLQERPARSA
jgi:hypothetical protein